MSAHIDEILERELGQVHYFTHLRARFRAVAEAAYESGVIGGALGASGREHESARMKLAKEMLAVGMYYGEITEGRDLIRFRMLRVKLAEAAGLREQSVE